MFAFQDSTGPVDVAFTDRHGGVSGGEYASLNLSERAGEDAAAVERNLELVVRAFAPGSAVSAVVRMRQVHGSDVHVVGREHPYERGHRPVADGLVTDVPGVALMVRVADCVPVLIADPANAVVGAAHAGRPGMVAGIVPNTVAAMRGLGAERLTAWMGPHVCGRCYEVPEAMRAEVAAVVPESYAETSWGTPAVDVGAGVRAQLAAAGVTVVDSPSHCTIEDENLFSYRRQGPESGRMAGLVWVRP